MYQHLSPREAAAELDRLFRRALRVPDVAAQAVAEELARKLVPWRALPSVFAGRRVLFLELHDAAYCRREFAKRRGHQQDRDYWRKQHARALRLARLHDGRGAEVTS